MCHFEADLREILRSLCVSMHKQTLPVIVASNPVEEKKNAIPAAQLTRFSSWLNEIARVEEIIEHQIWFS